MTQTSYSETPDISEPPIAAIILVNGKAEAAIQLFENVLVGEENLVIVAHVGKAVSGERAKIQAWIEETGAPVLVNTESLYTRRGYIAHAICNTLAYAVAHCEATRFVLLPFNCVKVLCGFSEEVRHGPCRYEGRTVYEDFRTTIMGGFQRSLSGRRMLYSELGKARALKGQHEGVVFDRSVAQRLATFSLPRSGLYYEIARWISFLSRRWVRLFPFAYEEFLVPSVIAAGTSEHGNNPICYLDWDRFGKPPGYDELPWEELPNHTYFYKWVPVEMESEIRQSMFESLPLGHRERCEEPSQDAFEASLV